MTGGLQLRVDAPEHPGRESDLPGQHAAARQRAQRRRHAHRCRHAWPERRRDLQQGVLLRRHLRPTSHRGVPLTRIDFSGYGASIFSHWQNPNAAIAATSQAYFDVFVGRTAHEVIQVRSLVYPLGHPRRCERSRCSAPAAPTSSATTRAGRRNPTASTTSVTTRTIPPST